VTPDLDLTRPSIEVGQQLVMQCSHVVHPLLDLQLVGKQFKVVANGGNFKQKEIVVGIVLISGQLSIQHNNTRLLNPYLLNGFPSSTPIQNVIMDCWS